MVKRWHERRTGRCQRGATAVEFALTAPILMLLVFSAVESLLLYTTANSLQNAAYEGARKGIVPGATSAGVSAECERILKASRVRGYAVEIRPAQIAATTREVTVHVSAPSEENSLGLSRFFGGQVLERSFTLRREGFAEPPAPPASPGKKKGKDKDKDKDKGRSSGRRR